MQAGQMDKEVRVRFAPSPTGVLHLGGARTAIHNWLFARSKGGKFLLRIEDTDVARSNRATVSQIIDSLRWLGLNWDEKIVFQSERLDIYRKKAEELIEKGLAYRCFCDVKEIEEAKKDAKSYKYSGKCRNLTPEEVRRNLRNGKPYAVRIKIDPGKISWKDLIYGEIEVDTEELDDFIILRSNGIPTYHFAVVVDDIYMKITHVIRGEDHIPNTPKHIVLYKAFNQRVPKFAHLPLLLGVDGKRLSKRHGATGVDEYREMGFLPEAVFNYLAIIGTSISADNQILTSEELINRYNVKKVARKSAVFDVKKLEWMNKKHISKKSAEELYNVVVQIFQRYELLKASEVRKDYILNIINLMKGRVVKLTDFAKWGKYFFLDPADYDSDALSKYWDDKTCEFLKVLKQALEELQKFDSGSIEGALRKTAERLGIKAAQLIHPFRIALTGFGVSPDIFEIASLLKKETVLRRLDNIINFYS